MTISKYPVFTATFAALALCAGCAGNSASTDGMALGAATTGGGTTGTTPPVTHDPNIQTDPPAPVMPTGPATFLSTGDGNFVVGPTYVKAPEFTVAAGVPTGTIQVFSMSSAGSQFYDGQDTALYAANRGTFTRGVWVYIPNGYKAGTKVPLMVIQDGGDFYKDFQPVLDNMIADGRLPAMVAIFVNSGGGDSYGSERGLEYDTVSDTYVNFVETELLPAVVTHSNVAFSDNPWDRATVGLSSGGAAAFGMAWYHNTTWTRVLTYSGTYVNRVPSTNPHGDPNGAADYWKSFVPASAELNLRACLQTSDNDLNYGGDQIWNVSNMDMFAALTAKNYHVRFNYATGGVGHEYSDKKAWYQTLPTDLLWLWRAPQ